MVLTSQKQNQRGKGAVEAIIVIGLIFTLAIVLVTWIGSKTLQVITAPADKVRRVEQDNP